MHKFLKVSLSCVAALSMASASMVVVQPGLFGTSIVAAQEGPVTLYQKYGAPHGDKSFASAVVAVQGDKIVAVDIDEYQFVEGDGWTAVPNADGEFGKAFPEGQTLISKDANSDKYSELMAEKAQATQKLSDNKQAIYDFVKGKSIDELQATVDELAGLGEDGNVSDVVSGSTLADTGGYIQLIMDTVKEGRSYEGAEGSDITLKQGLAAAHGDKSFAQVTVTMAGDTIVGSFIDEFQFVEGDGWTGVPNSDGEFGKAYPEGQTLISKIDNSEQYSKLMTEKAQSTVAYADNHKAIADAVKGKTVEEAKALAEEVKGLGEDGNVSDIVSGATLADTGNYIQAIVDVASK